MLFKSPTLGKEELRVIDALKSIYNVLRYALSTPARWNGVLRRNMFARAIQGSNSIEGYMVTKEDALAAVEGEKPLDANTETWLAIVGYRNALTYVLQLAKDQRFVFNEGFLRSLHYMMISHDLSKHPGNWRPGPIYVRDESRGENVYEGPPADILPRLIKELTLYLMGSQDKEHLIVKAAMAHLNLVMIHPFSDGNGRMGRCLQTLVLTSRGIGDPAFSSIEEYLGRNTQAYYSVLAETGQGSWNPQNSTRKWIRFNLAAHYIQAVTMLSRTRMIAKLWGELETYIKNHHLPDRVIFALSDTAMGYQLRSSHYRHAAEVSAVLASRDLKSLVTAGMLLPSGERRGRVYRASDSLRDVWLRIRNDEPRKIADPFETLGDLVMG